LVLMMRTLSTVKQKEAAAKDKMTASFSSARTAEFSN
jgi:hypothetical protein